MYPYSPKTTCPQRFIIPLYGHHIQCSCQSCLYTHGKVYLSSFQGVYIRLCVQITWYYVIQQYLPQCDSIALDQVFSYVVLFSLTMLCTQSLLSVQIFSVYISISIMFKLYNLLGYILFSYSCFPIMHAQSLQSTDAYYKL